MQDIKDADPQCNITRSEKQRCASFRMRMYPSPLKGNPEKYVCTLKPKVYAVFVIIFHDEIVWSWTFVIVALPSPTKDIKEESRKSKFICKLMSSL